MTVFLYALVTVLSWGTWIGVAQRIPVRGEDVRTLHVTIGNLLFALVVAMVRGGVGGLPWNAVVLSFCGGLLWTAGGACAFAATSRIGIARAAGTWTPLNIGMGFVWGVLLFGELTGMTARQLGWLGGALLVIVLGLLLIVFAKGADSAARRRELAVGFVAAIGAGLLWGSYFVPVQLSGTSPWLANLPMAVGMVVGASALALRRGVPPLPASGPRGVLVLLSAGVLWGAGNIGMLLLVAAIGTGTGFTIAQLSLLVNAVVGVYLFRDPAPRSRAAALTLLGVVLAGAGGVVLGNLT